MADYIKREDALNRLLQYAGQVDCTNTLGAMIGVILRDIPAADVRPVVRGRWKRVDPRSTVVTFRCSECDYYAHMNATTFCPNCGADMREVDDAD